jgi:hypothetical protein
MARTASQNYPRINDEEKSGYLRNEQSKILFVGCSNGSIQQANNVEIYTIDSCPSEYASLSSM